MEGRDVVAVTPPELRCHGIAQVIIHARGRMYVHVDSTLFLVYAESLMTLTCSTMHEMCICYLAQEYQRIRVKLSSSGASKRWELHRHTLDRSRIFYPPNIVFDPSDGIQTYMCHGSNGNSVLSGQLVDFYQKYIYCKELRDLFMGSYVMP